MRVWNYVKEEEDEEKRPLNPPKTMGSAISIPGESYKASPRKDFYYTYGLVKILIFNSL